MELSRENWVAPDTQGQAAGLVFRPRVETVSVLRHYAGVATPLEASALVTTEFVPTGADFVPPRQA
ncbi:MAG TPA: hypothetical protein VGJ20_12230 [Xanthobacteraceae bacterium]